MLHQSYNIAQDRLINLCLLKEVLLYPNMEWPPFSKAEFINAISKCSNLSTLGPHHILWSHLKALIKDNKYITNFVKIANSCINLNYWLSYFKKSMSIIIPKPNKSLYNTSKTFQSIVFLNTVGKLIKKVISNRIQVHSITLNFIHST